MTRQRLIYSMDDLMTSLGMISLGSVCRAATAVARIAFLALCLTPVAALAGGTPPEDAAYQAQRPQQPGGPKSSPLGGVQAPVQAPAQQQPEQARCSRCRRRPRAASRPPSRPA